MLLRSAAMGSLSRTPAPGRRLVATLCACGLALVATAGSAGAAPSVTEYNTNLTANSTLEEIVAGRDGNLWFTEYGSPGEIVRITPAGAVTEFKAGVVPGFTANSGPYGITTGPDGNLWFTEANNPDAIGR